MRFLSLNSGPTGILAQLTLLIFIRCVENAVVCPLLVKARINLLLAKATAADSSRLAGASLTVHWASGRGRHKQFNEIIPIHLDDDGHAYADTHKTSLITALKQFLKNDDECGGGGGMETVVVLLSSPKKPTAKDFEWTLTDQRGYPLYSVRVQLESVSEEKEPHTNSHFIQVNADLRALDRSTTDVLHRKSSPPAGGGTRLVPDGGVTRAKLTLKSADMPKRTLINSQSSIGGHYGRRKALDRSLPPIGSLQQKSVLSSSATLAFA